MTPERVTPMTDEEIRYFAELEVDLDDAPTVRVEVSLPSRNWELIAAWLIILTVLAAFWGGIGFLIYRWAVR